MGPERLRIQWDRVPDEDIRAYRLFWRATGATETDTMDVGNVDQYLLASLVDYQSYDVWLEAYDIMDQVGAASEVLTAAPSPLGDATPPAVPTDLSAAYDPQTNVAGLTWTECPEAIGYRVYYDTDVIGSYQGTGATEGDSPVLQGRTGSLTLSGLPPGRLYYVTVSALDAMGNESLRANPIAILVSATTDTDQDGLPDDWENANLGSLQFGPTDDPDGDLLDNQTELFVTRTHPNRWDTDSDQVPDGSDINTPHGPLSAADSDMDGLPDDWEQYYNVYDPQGDEDADLLVNAREYIEHSYPRDPDSDEDGLGDGFEADSLGTDASNPDTDGGGEWDGSEYFSGRNPLDPQDDQPGADVPDAAVNPVRFALFAGRPNPFTDVTWIRYDLPERTGVLLRVYDPSGRIVRSLVETACDPAGSHMVRWDGRDDQHRAVPSGVYFLRIEAGPLAETRRLVLVR